MQPRSLHLALLSAAPLLAPAARAQDNDLFALGDEFSDPARASEWTQRHQTEGLPFDPLELFELSGPAAPGALRLVPHTVTWYAGYKGPLVYKLVDGDFALTTSVAISNRAGSGLPASTYSLGGLMLRAPTASLAQPEDYVFLSIGRTDSQHWPQAGAGAHFEVKSTDDGVSQLEASAAGAPLAELQLARFGSAVIALYRRPGEAWVVHRRYDRADLPSTLQAGLVAYTDWRKCETYSAPFHNTHLLSSALSSDPSSQPALPFAPDLDARFDFARFQRVFAPHGFDALAASDAQLLALLGDNALALHTSYCTATTSSQGCAGTLSATGAASAGSGASYVLRASAVDGQRSGLVFYGFSGTTATPWGPTGWLCVKAPTQRTANQTSGGALGACDGELTLDWNAFAASHPTALGAPLQGGETCFAQAWWRDPPSAKSTALSNAWAFVVTP